MGSPRPTCDFMGRHCPDTVFACVGAACPLGVESPCMASTIQVATKSHFVPPTYHGETGIGTRRHTKWPARAKTPQKASVAILAPATAGGQSARLWRRSSWPATPPSPHAVMPHLRSPEARLRRRTRAAARGYLCPHPKGERLVAVPRDLIRPLAGARGPDPLGNA